jgi:GrpB-like predicted nucleotidyltransferase (UPF0157 family)
MPADTEICHFVQAGEIKEEVESYFNKEIKNLRGLLGHLVVGFEHVGGTAIPGALTKKDVDIQIRISKEDFSKVIELMKTCNKIKKLEIWTQNKAIFKNKEKDFSTDYLVTVVNSDADVYYKARELLKNNSQLLSKYNKLKKSFEGKTYMEYRPAKDSFWREIGALIRSE